MEYIPQINGWFYDFYSYYHVNDFGTRGSYNLFLANQLEIVLIYLLDSKLGETRYHFNFSTTERKIMIIENGHPYLILVFCLRTKKY